MAIKTEHPFRNKFLAEDQVGGSDRDTMRTSMVQRTLDAQRTENIGDGTNIKYDGANRRIIIKDSDNDRVLIGYQEDGF